MAKNTRDMAKNTPDIDKNTSDIDKNTSDIDKNTSDISISIRNIIMIYHGSPYEMQTEMQGEWQRVTTAEKKLWEGARPRPAEGRPPPNFFSAVLILCQGSP